MILGWLPIIVLLGGISIIVQNSIRQIKEIIETTRADINQIIRYTGEISTRDVSQNLSQELPKGIAHAFYEELRREPGETNEQAIARWMERRYGFEEGITPSQEL